MHESYRKTLKQLLDQLPCSLDDSVSVGELFAKWQQTNDPNTKRDLDLWVYTYIYRYFAYKFASSRVEMPSRLDEAISKTFRKVQDRSKGIRDASKYAHWVRAVCYRTFINFTRSARPFVSFDEEWMSIHNSDLPIEPIASDALRAALETAIENLSHSLRDSARLYYLNRLDAHEIAEVLGLELPRIRVNLSRAKKKLSLDPTLQRFFDQLQPDSGS